VKNGATRLHLCATGDSADGVCDWLEAECGIARGELATTIAYPAPDGTLREAVRGVPAISMQEAATRVAADDAVIVAGPEFQRAVADLFGMGIRNLYNGNDMIRRHSVAARFIEAASALYIGPTAPTGDLAVTPAAGRFGVEPIAARQVPPHKLFIVNSMPKSGTVWMAAMLEDLLGVPSHDQITISHVADIEDDWHKENNHGAVTLVRDMRDVVVSWFHDATRADLALGFAAPRYPDLAAFYHEFFIGTIFGTRRFYFGDLERWLNLVSAHYIPLIKYEDMVADTEACLRKVMTFWRVDVSTAAIQQVVREHVFASMAQKVGGGRGFVADMVRQGHLRRGRSGSWRDEMPEAIATDVNQRFAGYQRRLGYASPQ
jgi:hypothetical protein